MIHAETEKNPRDEQDAGAEPSMESLLREQASFQERLKAREVVWVRVIQSGSQGVLVDVGEKREALVPASDFPSGGLPAAGSRIPAVLSHQGRDDRPATLSHKSARAQLGWDQALKAFAEKTRVRGTVTAAIKGGFLVDVGGASAFLPSSLADLRPVRKPQAMIDTGVRCYIIEVNKDKKQMVLSRKAVLQEELDKRREKLLAALKVGEVRIGRVLHLSPTGAAVDLGGLEGFLPLAEMAWKEPEKARDGLSRGQKLRAKVLRIESEGGKVTLGLKQLTANPADGLKRKYPPKTVVHGTVSEVKPDGVRVQVAAGVTAFCAAAELPTEGGPAGGKGRTGERAPASKPLWPAAGAKVGAVVLGIYYATLELSISIRRFEDAQDRKQMAKYLKTPRPLTLGEILTPQGDS